MWNIDLQRIYKSVFINHMLNGEHVTMDLRHLLLIWKNSRLVLKPLFRMSTAGWVLASSMPVLVLSWSHCYHWQRASCLGGGVQLLKQTRPHPSEQPCFYNPTLGSLHRGPQQFWSSPCLFQQERDSCFYSHPWNQYWQRHWKPMVHFWRMQDPIYLPVPTQKQSFWVLPPGQCRSAHVIPYSEVISSLLSLQETCPTLWQS